jgi:hypothetical protein
LWYQKVEAAVIALLKESKLVWMLSIEFSAAFSSKVLDIHITI